MLDIECPFSLGGMGGIGGPLSDHELAAGVSSARGLGILGRAFLKPLKCET